MLNIDIFEPSKHLQALAECNAKHAMLEANVCRLSYTQSTPNKHIPGI